MKEHLELIGEIDTGITAIQQIYANYTQFKSEILSNTGKTKWNAIILVKLIADYYTCAESIFLKISQHFENHLDRDHWHSQLLHKMGVNIPGVRPAFLSEPAVAAFRELMAFRHFTRYYFEMEYDWQKLDFLAVKLEAAHEHLIKHTALFRKLLIE